MAGIFGARLPKSGKWMEYVKYGFAVIILISAYWQIEKGFSVLGYKNMNFYIIILGLILITTSVLLGLRPPEKTDRPALTRFLFALFALAFGIAVIIKGINSDSADQTDRSGSGNTSALSQNDGKYNTLEDIARAEPEIPSEMIAGLKFYRDDNFARKMANLTGKPLFVDFYADWCTNCKDFYKLLEHNPDLTEAMKNAVLLKVIDTDTVFTSHYADNPSYPELSVGLPFFIILNSDETLRWKTTDYRDTSGMIKNLK